MEYTKIRGSNYYFNDLNPDKKEIILLIHGHPFDHTMWQYQIEELNDSRLILPDLRGYGKTDYKFDKISIEEHALDLALLLDYLNIEKVHLIGLSMGGQIIIEFSRLFPHRVFSLVLCDSNPSGETEITYQSRLKLADRMMAIGMKAYTIQDIDKYLHPDTIKQKGDIYSHLFQMMINTKVENAFASHRGRAERRDNSEYLKEIKVPALIIVGDNDFFTPISEMKEIANKIPNSNFAIIKNSGHMPNMEQAKAFNTLLLDFYGKQRNE